MSPLRLLAGGWFLASLVLGYLVYLREGTPWGLVLVGTAAAVLSSLGAFFLRRAPRRALALIELRFVTQGAILALLSWGIFSAAGWAGRSDSTDAAVVLGALGSLGAELLLRAMFSEQNSLSSAATLRRGLARAFRGVEFPNDGDCDEQRAASEAVFTAEAGPVQGWGLDARWERVGILSDFVAGEANPRSIK